MTFEDVIPKDDMAAYQNGFYFHRMSYGTRSAILVVDMVNAFVDPAYPLANGDMGRAATNSLQRLLETARKRNVFVVYSKVFPSSSTDPTKAISRRRMFD